MNPDDDFGSEGRFNNTGGSHAMDGNTTMSASFRTRNTAKTGDELRKARESRASEALKMKDEQLKILSDQNVVLLQNLDKVRNMYVYSCAADISWL